MATTFLGAAASVNTGDTITVTVPINCTTSHGIVIALVHDTGGGAGSISDNAGGGAGNTYTQRDNFGTGSYFTQLYDCAPVGIQLNSGQTISFNVGTSQQGAMFCWAFNNCAASPFDGTGGSSNAEGRGGPTTSPSDNLQSSVTSNATDELFGIIMANTNSTLTGVTAGWNAESTASVITGSTGTSGTVMKLFGFSQEVSAAGTYHLAGTFGTSSTFLLVAGQYKFTAPAGGGALAPPLSMKLQAVKRSALI